MTFPCSMWFSRGKGDGLLERELFPEGSPQAVVQVPYKVHCCASTAHWHVPPSHLLLHTWQHCAEGPARHQQHITELNAHSFVTHCHPATC